MTEFVFLSFSQIRPIKVEKEEVEEAVQTGKCSKWNKLWRRTWNR